MNDTIVQKMKTRADVEYSPEEIVDIIRERGRFGFCPYCWTDTTKASLDQLCAENKIRPCTVKEEEMNPSYVYVFV